ncbi:MAG: hypothetical protein ACUVUF_01090 [Candidatus Bathycorpusculaceae bacterium]
MKTKFKRFFCDKRAITPVLSNLLLMVVAVAAMAIATTSTYVVTTKLRENMSERLLVEDVWFDSTNGIMVYLRNIGKVAIDISRVYVNSTPQPFSSPFHLKIDEHGWLNVSHSWVSGEIYYVDVVTTRGNHAGGYYKAP